MVNLIYDIPLSDEWSLSLGGGVGAGNVGEHLKEVGLPAFKFTRGAHVEFEWQAIAGLNYQLSDDLQLFADYRFRSAEADHDYASDFAAFDPIHVYQLQEHVGMIGIRWYLSRASAAPAAAAASPRRRRRRLRR